LAINGYTDTPPPFRPFYSYVLDGYPQTQRQVELLTERCIIPFRIIELDVKSKEIMVRATKDRIGGARYVLACRGLH